MAKYKDPYDAIRMSHLGSVANSHRKCSIKYLFLKISKYSQEKKLGQEKNCSKKKIALVSGNAGDKKIIHPSRKHFY